MNEPTNPPSDVGANYLDAFAGQGPKVGVVERTTRTPKPKEGVGAITVREVRPITDGIVDSVAVMWQVEGPDTEAKKKLAEAWVPAANKYEKWFRATPEVAALLGTLVCFAPMYKEYSGRKRAEKASEAGEKEEYVENVEAVRESEF